MFEREKILGEDTFTLWFARDSTKIRLKREFRGNDFRNRGNEERRETINKRTYVVEFAR